MTQQSRIRIKYGAIEIEYEGPEQFLKEELSGLVAAISNLAHPPAEPEADVGSAAFKSVMTTTASPTVQLAPNSIAAKIGVKAGSDLVIAAAGYLELVMGKASHSRQEIHDAMKQATQYYKEGYGSNLSKYIQVIVKDGRMNEISSGKYALSAAQRTAIGAAIA